MTQSHGSEFDSIYKMYSKYPDRFIVFCGLDYSGYDNPGYEPAEAMELERCVKAGARGVGKLMFKGKSPEGRIMLPDDPRLDMLNEKCAGLKIPVNLHISEDKWMYEKMDSANDGMMTASKWQIRNDDDSKTHDTDYRLPVTGYSFPLLNLLILQFNFKHFIFSNNDILNIINKG
jgi:uncharacterized protein